MPAIRPKTRKDLAIVELEGEAVIYDERGRSLHHLNPTASLVFSLFDGTATVKELASDIAKAYGAPVVKVERHIRTLYRDFQKAELLEVEGASLDGRRTRRTRRRPGKENQQHLR